MQVSSLPSHSCSFLNRKVMNWTKIDYGCQQEDWKMFYVVWDFQKHITCVLHSQFALQKPCLTATSQTTSVFFMDDNNTNCNTVLRCLKAWLHHGVENTHCSQLEKHAQFDAAVSWSTSQWCDSVWWNCIAELWRDGGGHGCGAGQQAIESKGHARQDKDQRRMREKRREKWERGLWVWTVGPQSRRHRPGCHIVQTAWCTQRNLI